MTWRVLSISPYIKASFADALKEWRSGGRDDPDRPTSAPLTCMEVQTEAPQRVVERPATARPGTAKAGGSYFDRLYAKNVERMVAPSEIARHVIDARCEPSFIELNHILRTRRASSEGTTPRRRRMRSTRCRHARRLLRDRRPRGRCPPPGANVRALVRSRHPLAGGPGEDTRRRKGGGNWDGEGGFNISCREIC
jgi:hypothetical protein